MRFANGIKLDFNDVLIVPQRTTISSRSEVDVRRSFNLYHTDKVISGVPIIASNMSCTGTIAMNDSLSKLELFTAINKFDSKKYLDSNNFNYGFLTIGQDFKDYDILKHYSSLCSKKKIAMKICIDVANGYSEDFVDFCASIRKKYRHSVIMAGNVCTPEMTQELIIRGGVDIVKVGIGPGSVCRTRTQTGIGYPQLSAIIECASVAHGIKSAERRNGLICADGGCIEYGDVCKAFCAGADFVMLGGIFSGCDECQGEWTHKLSGRRHENGESEFVKRSLKFYGMSSNHANKELYQQDKKYKVSEGIVAEVPYKGPASQVVSEILGGIRSCCSYIGSTSIKDMSKCAVFAQVNRTHNTVFENLKIGN